MNFDELLSQQEQLSQEKPFDREAWAAQKKQQREQVYVMADATAVEIGRDPEKFEQYLNVQSKFERNSVLNAMLILAQMPQATKLGEYEYWKARNVFVQKGAKGISILEPGSEYRREDGSIGMSYNVKTVFDISQTKQRKQPAPMIDTKQLITALAGAAPVGIAVVDTLPNERKAAYDAAARVIHIKRGLPPNEIVQHLSLELAHAEYAAGKPDYQRDTNAFRAYCVSYMLCKKFGIDTKGYNVKNVPPSMEELDSKGVRLELATMRDVFHDITQRMDRTLTRAEQPRQQGQQR